MDIKIKSRAEVTLFLGALRARVTHLEALQDETASRAVNLATENELFYVNEVIVHLETLIVSSPQEVNTTIELSNNALEEVVCALRAYRQSLAHLYTIETSAISRAAAMEANNIGDILMRHDLPLVEKFRGHADLSKPIPVAPLK